MNIEEELKNYILHEFHAGKRIGKFNYEDDLLDKGILDSFAILQVATHLEETFRIEVGDDEIISENFSSVVKLAEFVKRKLNNDISCRLLKKADEIQD